MANESTVNVQRQPRTKVVYKNGASQAVYGLGMFGAWFYYFTTATSLWVGVLGFFKGILWPAFLVYEWMMYLGM